MVHLAPDTTSLITSKSISKGGGRGAYRGLVRVEDGSETAKSFVDGNAGNDVYGEGYLARLSPWGK